MDHWEMYDLQEDPREMNNIYDDPAYEAVRTNLHRKLQQLRTQYDESSGDDQASNRFQADRSLLVP
jgi:hypothetical protein